MSGDGFHCHTGDGVPLALTGEGAGMIPTRNFLVPNVNIVPVEKPRARGYKYLR